MRTRTLPSLGTGNLQGPFTTATPGVYVPEYDPWLVYGEPIGAGRGGIRIQDGFLAGPGIAFGFGFGVGFLEGMLGLGTTGL